MKSSIFFGKKFLSNVLSSIFIITTMLLAGSFFASNAYAAAPTITSVTPATSTTAGGGTMIISGNNLATTTSVTIGGNLATTTASSTTSVTVVIPATNTPGFSNIIVTNASGTAATSTAFTYISVPTITSITPASIPESNEGTITIIGTGFATSTLASTTVTIGGVSATNIVVVSSTQITCIAPAGVAGTADVVFTNPDAGSITLVGGFTYTALGGRSNVVSVTGVSINETINTLIVGNTYQLAATIAPSDANNQNILWLSSNSIVATVSNTGLVTAISPGTATITVTTADGNFVAGDVLTVNSTGVVMSGGGGGGGSVYTPAVIATAATTTQENTTTTLTEAQVSAIVSLLQSFGADAGTIANVQASLTGTPVTSMPAMTSGTSAYTFTADLTLGSTGADVTALQNMLIAQGDLVMPAGVAEGYFGALTQSALAKFQAANNISPAAGYFGPKTRASIKLMSK